MRPAVAARFLEFTRPLEGTVEYMYVDVKGLVTIGIGNLIDPIGVALALPFVKKVGGAAATPAEITTEWTLIKDADNSKQLKTKGHTACTALTKLKLTDAAILDLCTRRLSSNELELKKVKEFKTFDEWPADAQLALQSMAWAMGGAFAAGTLWPSFRAACATMDFDGAAANCKMNESGNPGLIPRNAADVQLFKNAAAVMAGEADKYYNRDTLYYPLVLLKPIVITP